MTKKLGWFSHAGYIDLHSLVRMLTLTAVCVGYCDPSFGSDAGSDCEEYKAVHVQGRSGLTSEAEYLNVRTQLLDQLLVEAVAQVNGAELRSRETTQLTVKNSKVDDRYSLINVRRSKGLVKSYSFTPNGESIEDTDIGKMLVLALDVIVCDQSGLDDFLYVTVDNIEFRGFEQFSEMYLKEVVLAALPEGTNLRLVEEEADAAYFDYVVTGKILDLAATREDSTFKALIGNVVRTGDGRPIVNSGYTRMSATIALKAENAVDLSYTIVTETVEEKVSVGMHEGALAQRLDEFVGRALGQVSEKLYLKIVNHEGFKQSVSRK